MIKVCGWCGTAYAPNEDHDCGRKLMAYQRELALEQRRQEEQRRGARG